MRIPPRVTEAGVFNRADRSDPSDCMTASLRSRAGAGASSWLPGACAPTGAREGRTAPAHPGAMPARKRRELDGAASWRRPGGVAKKHGNERHNRMRQHCYATAKGQCCRRYSLERHSNSFIKPNCTVLLLCGHLLVSRQHPGSSSARGDYALPPPYPCHPLRRDRCAAGVARSPVLRPPLQPIAVARLPSGQLAPGPARLPATRRCALRPG